MTAVHFLLQFAVVVSVLLQSVVVVAAAVFPIGLAFGLPRNLHVPSLAMKFGAAVEIRWKRAVPMLRLSLVEEAMKKLRTIQRNVATAFVAFEAGQ